MQTRRWLCVGFCLIVLLGTLQLWAYVTGSIVGYVRDRSGAVIPNATVVATQSATGYNRTVTTDSSGQYTLLALPPGHYRLTAQVANFQRREGARKGVQRAAQHSCFFHLVQFPYRLITVRLRSEYGRGR